MAQKNEKFVYEGPKHRKTSIGNSSNSRPRSKQDKRNFKKYKGQGK